MLQGWWVISGFKEISGLKMKKPAGGGVELPFAASFSNVSSVYQLSFFMIFKF
jgi:hypothetical protein